MIAETRVRYDCRRIHVLLQRDRLHGYAKHVCQLYRETGLQLRRKSPNGQVKAKLLEDRTPTSATVQSERLEARFAINLTVTERCIVELHHFSRHVLCQKCSSHPADRTGFTFHSTPSGLASARLGDLLAGFDLGATRAASRNATSDAIPAAPPAGRLTSY